MAAWRGNTVTVTTASVNTASDRRDTVKDVKATERITFFFIFCYLLVFKCSINEIFYLGSFSLV